MAADAPALEGIDIVGATTEDAGGFQLAKHYSRPLDGDEELIALPDIEEPARLRRDDDPPEVIDLPSDAGFQSESPLRWPPENTEMSRWASSR